MLLEPGPEHFVDEAFDRRPHLGGDQLFLGLRGKLRVGSLDRKHASQAFAAIVAVEIDLLALCETGALGVAGHLTGQPRAQTREMRPAVALRNIVGEGEHMLVVGIVPPKGRFDRDIFAFALDHDRVRDERRLGAIEVAHESLKAAVVVKLLPLDLGAACVGEFDAHPGIQEGEFAQTMFDHRIVEIDHREGLGRSQKGDFGTAFGFSIDFRRGPCDFKRHDRVAMFETKNMLLAVAPDPQCQPAGKCVDHGNTHAMQSARHFIGFLIEFSAGVQLGHDDLRRRNTLLTMNIRRNPAPVVGDSDRTVGIERHRDARSVAGQRLVDGVINDFIDHVMEAGAIVGIADIHAWAFAHGIEAAQHRDRIGAVIGFCFGGQRDRQPGGGFGHGECGLSALGKG